MKVSSKNPTILKTPLPKYIWLVVLWSAVSSKDVRTNFERVKGGERVPSSSAFPFMVYLTFDPNDASLPHFCGASIIHEGVVLTAAHCTPSGVPIYVIAGQLDRSVKSKNRQVRRVAKLVRHEHFNETYFGNNDIALLFLDSDLKMSKRVQPILLLEAYNKRMIQRAVLTGWGMDSGGLVSEYLKAATLHHMDCSSLRAEKRTSDSMICFGDSHHNMCPGDSGSPLIVAAHEGATLVWQQLAIASRVDSDCTKPQRPAVFIDVTKYIDWIHKNIDAHLA